MRDFDVEHTKRMHLIVVRRDLTGFQHLHPRMAADGTWEVPVRLDRAPAPTASSPTSRATARRRRWPTTSRSTATPAATPLPAPEPTAVSDGGYDVGLDRGRSRRRRAGRPRVRRSRATASRSSVEPYLGADGHLVALREGDLAFLHVHPSRRGAAPGEIAFVATFPTAGRYRLFLQFQDDGGVHTVAFTQEVE